MPAESLPRIGEYQLLRRLGEGATGAVYEAVQMRDDGFRRFCALKLIPLEPGSLGRRLPIHEAITSDRFEHPNLVRAFDVGTWGEPGTAREHCYIAMERIDGLDFRQLIRLYRKDGARPPLSVVLALTIPVCDALHYAHLEAHDDRGQPLRLIHGLIKPTRLMVSRFGQVKLLNMGLAQSSPSTSPGEKSIVRAPLTYRSPEQLRDETPDCRTDIFSLGLVMFELATLERPGDGTMKRDLHLPTTTEEVLAGLERLSMIQPVLAPVLTRALAELPAERYPTPRAFGNALRLLQKDFPLEAPLSRTLASYLDDEQPTVLETMPKHGEHEPEEDDGDNDAMATHLGHERSLVSLAGDRAESPAGIRREHILTAAPDFDATTDERPLLEDPPATGPIFGGAAALLASSFNDARSFRNLPPPGVAAAPASGLPAELDAMPLEPITAISAPTAPSPAPQAPALASGPTPPRASAPVAPNASEPRQQAAGPATPRGDASATSVSSRQTVPLARKLQNEAPTPPAPAASTHGATPPSNRQISPRTVALVAVVLLVLLLLALRWLR